MFFRVLADLTVIIHLAFIGFVLLGGLLAWRWPWVAWLHLPAVLWAVGVEWSGEVCPLTPLENWFRTRGGLGTYGGDFVGRYVLPLLYPARLSRRVQFILGALVLLVNVAVYREWWRRRSATRL